MLLAHTYERAMAMVGKHREIIEHVVTHLMAERHIGRARFEELVASLDIASASEAVNG